MPSPPPFVSEALSSLKAMLEADGYVLVLAEDGPDTLVVRIDAGPEACADCLVPKEMMKTYFEEALRPVCELGMPEIRLLYPGDTL